ncbi:hypothetical protein NJ7G_3044 [Natrinema sp. J7-2]|nr:hypothetical protein NJ7G_3044 [Natrinema sp. J7-2]
MGEFGLFIRECREIVIHTSNQGTHKSYRSRSSPPGHGRVRSRSREASCVVTVATAKSHHGETRSARHRFDRATRLESVARGPKHDARRSGR